MEVNPELILTTIQEMIAGLLSILPSLVIGLLVFALFFLVARRAQAGIKSLVVRYGRSPNAGTVLGLMAQWGLILSGGLVALAIILPSVDPGDVLGVLGVGSVAIGFAFRNVFENFLAGIIILLTEPFAIGDQIVVDDLEGTVENIETRATTIKTYDNRRIVIPNATVFANPVTVNTAHTARRSEHEIGIGYPDDIDRASEVMLTTMRAVDGVLAEPAPDVLVSELGDSSVVLRPRWWTNAGRSDVVRTKSEVIRRIKYALDENGIDIPFPIRTVYFHDSSKAANGAG